MMHATFRASVFQRRFIREKLQYDNACGRFPVNFSEDWRLLFSDFTIEADTENELIPTYAAMSKFCELRSDNLSARAHCVRSTA